MAVQPYAFTTRSLFVGHLDHRFLRWACIDTPGILDHSLEERNTIEMQSITALAHLHAAILYVIDVSSECGYSVAQQVALYDSIRPLFVNKPLIFVLNKIDVRKVSELSAEDRALIDRIRGEVSAVVECSTKTGEGVDNVKCVACDKLLEDRVDRK